MGADLYHKQEHGKRGGCFVPVSKKPHSFSPSRAGSKERYTEDGKQQSTYSCCLQVGGCVRGIPNGESLIAYRWR